MSLSGPEIRLLNMNRIRYQVALSYLQATNP